MKDSEWKLDRTNVLIYLTAAVDVAVVEVCSRILESQLESQQEF